MKTNINKILKYVFYGMLALALIFCFIPFFRIDIRPRPDSEHIYVFRSLFTQGFPSNSNIYYSLPFHYLPILVLAIVAIPYVNRILVLTDILLGLSVVSCFIEMFWFNNDLMFGLLLVFIVIITSLYNIVYFLEKNTREREKNKY